MKQYHDILRSILEHGTEHQDRTGVGTISHFGFQTRFDLRDRFSDRHHQESSLSLGRRRVVLVSLRRYKRSESAREGRGHLEGMGR